MTLLVLLSTCITVLVTTWIHCPICCDAQLWDDTRDHLPFMAKVQPKPALKSLPLAKRGGTPNAASSAVGGIAANEETPNIAPKVASDIDVDPKKTLNEKRRSSHRRRKHRRNKHKGSHSRKRNHQDNEMGKPTQPKTEELGNGRRVCSVVSENNLLTEAVNNYGEIVQIAPELGHDGTVKGAHFHETYCTSERESCEGIDRSEYHSYCQTYYRYVYAQTVGDDGTVGLSLVKIRSGCNCIIQKKLINFYNNIMNKIG